MMIRMTRTIAAIAALGVALSANLLTATPVHAQTKAKPAVKKTAKPAKKKIVRKSSGSSAAERQARAFKRLKDYNYVKSMSPYAGSPNKWGPKW